MIKRITALCAAVILTAALSLPALGQITAAPFAKSGVYTRPITFSAVDFKTSTGTQADSIAVTLLPTKGTLTLDGTPVVKDASIDKDALAGLVYTPTSVFAGTDSFQWTATVDTETSAAVSATLTYSTPKPTANNGTLSVTRNKTATGTLTGTTLAGLSLTYAIKSPAAKGEVTITNSNTGAYKYEPHKDALGADSFTFVTLVAGQTDVESEPATITVTIEPEKVTPDKYADLTNKDGTAAHWAYTSAGSLKALQKVVGEKLKDEFYFYPDRTVTRVEFVTMLNSVMNIPLSTEAASEFEDVKLFHQIAVVNAAKDKGYVHGTRVGTKDYFYPDRSVTRVEAIKMIDNALDVPYPNTVTLAFSDKAGIPTWADKSVKNMVGYGIVTGTSGALRPLDNLTRGEAAEMLFKLYNELEKIKPTTTP